MAGGGKNSFTFHRLTNFGGEVLGKAAGDDDHSADTDADHMKNDD